jgi:hypothetical protein
MAHRENLLGNYLHFCKFVLQAFLPANCDKVSSKKLLPL